MRLQFNGHCITSGSTRLDSTRFDASFYSRSTAVVANHCVDPGPRPESSLYTATMDQAKLARMQASVRIGRFSLHLFEEPFLGFLVRSLREQQTARCRGRELRSVDCAVR